MTTGEDVTITWLGHATVRITAPDGSTILMEPWIPNNPGVPEQHKEIGKVDLMLISHGHFDAMGDAVQIARKTGCTVIAQKEICDYLSSQGVESCNGMNVGGSQMWNGIKVTQTTAVHSSSIGEGAEVIYGGLAVGYVLTFPNDFTVYHACDTALFSDMKYIGQFYRPDVAILPIGDHFTMGPKEAAEAIRLIGAPAVIPVHWGTFPVLTGTPDALQQETKDISGLKLVVLQPGQSVSQGDLV